MAQIGVRRLNVVVLIATYLLLQRYLEPLISAAGTLQHICTSPVMKIEHFTRFLLQEEDQSITYTNIITLSESGNIITHKKTVQIVAKCIMEKNSTLEVIYVTENNVIQNTTSVGIYNVSMSFYDSDSFSSPVLESPYYVDLNQTLFVQVSLHSTDPDLLVFIDTCRASPQSDFGSVTHDLIRSG